MSDPVAGENIPHGAAVTVKADGQVYPVEEAPLPGAAAAYLAAWKARTAIADAELDRRVDHLADADLQALAEGRSDLTFWHGDAAVRRLAGEVIRLQHELDFMHGGGLCRCQYCRQPRVNHA